MPDRALNTEVRGDLAACRETAKWLKDLAEGTHRAGDSLYRARSESMTTWQGQAGDAFRDSVEPKAKDTDKMHDRSLDLSKALSKLADDLHTVRSRMQQAREVAAGRNLTVTATEIHPPGAGPDPGTAPIQPPGGSSPGATAEYEAAKRSFAAAYTEHERQVNAFNEVATTTGEAREREQEAHRAFRDVTKQKGFFHQYGLTVANAVASTGSAVQGEIRHLSEKITHYNKAIDATKADITSAQSFGERKVLGDRLTALRQGIYDAEQQARNSKLVSYPMGGPVTKLNPGDFEKGAARVTATGRVGKMFPYVGTLLTAGTAANNIHDGKPAAKEVEKAVGGTAASIGTGAAAGACIGGPVGAAVGAVGGAAVSYGLGEFIDWKGGPVEKFNRWAGIE